MTPNVYAVVPTCRGFTVPSQTIDVKWVVVHDGQRWPVTGGASHIVAPDAQVYGSVNSSIRGAGFMHAFKAGASHILTTDDDCFIPPTWAEHHVDALDSDVPRWSYTVPSLRTRGMPYTTTPMRVAITHGLWDGVPDLDATSQLASPNLRIRNEGAWHPITPPFALSNMNLGFTRDATPLMYEWPMGPTTPYDRFEDIWMGLVAQRILSLHDWAILNGGSIVYHTRASNARENARKEAPAKEEHERLWQHIWGFNRKRYDLPSTMLAMATHIADYEPLDDDRIPYFKRVAANMRQWAEACYIK